MKKTILIFTKFIVIFSIFLLVSNCKKSKLGVLEIKHTTEISDEESTFRVILVEDGIYEEHTEFEYKTSQFNFESYTGYYWPNESAKSLGYNYKNKDSNYEVYFTTEKDSDYGPPGVNGHWKDYGVNNNSAGQGSTPYGRWQRYGSPGGYQTDLAIGNIPGQVSNRVYMCEHPGSPSAGLYKGTITGTTITWDPIHGLPNAEFNFLNGGPDRTLYFGVGSISDAGKYSTGVWTNTCPL